MNDLFEFYFENNSPILQGFKKLSASKRVNKDIKKNFFLKNKKKKKKQMIEQFPK